ncbi:GAF domain-containing protein [Halapricum desulfuricans]|uniref:Signal transduction histidine kinase n=1 Tax=Halapricum desulfuricans TaxID=2841257 RepID=A0A897N0R1_9EURY|nr:GAF domain-containing protein [Halapricum desulfuricans]QSG04923.1 Signal transduction histidine kinase [Halapricum desulfuricans]
MTDAEVRDYFQDLYRLGSDTSAPLEGKIEQAITIGRDRLDVDYGILSYTGSGDYEVIDSTIESGQYAAGSTHDLETTWCRDVVSDDETLAISDASDSPYSDDIARDVTGLQCYIGASIVVDGDTYGTLCFSGDEPRSSAFGTEKTVRGVAHPVDRPRDRT